MTRALVTLALALLVTARPVAAAHVRADVASAFAMAFTGGFAGLDLTLDAAVGVDFDRWAILVGPEASYRALDREFIGINDTRATFPEAVFALPVTVRARLGASHAVVYAAAGPMMRVMWPTIDGASTTETGYGAMARVGIGGELVGQGLHMALSVEVTYAWQDQSVATYANWMSIGVRVEYGRQTR